MYVSLLTLFFFLLSVFVLMDTGEKKSAHSDYIYWGAVFLMFLFAALRPIGVDHDSSNYQNLFIEGAQRENEVEFSFELIGNWVYNVWHEPRMLFVIYAFLSVVLKGIPIRFIGKDECLLALLVWISHFFLIQDLTQIRAAVSCTFFLIGVVFLLKSQRIPYVLCVLIAAFFHFSAFIFLLFTFFGAKELSALWKKALFCIPLLGYFFYLIHFDPFISLPIPYLQDKVELYETMRDTVVAGDEINVFSSLYLLKLVVFYFILWKYKYIVRERPGISLTLKIFAISFFCYPFFAFLPVLAFRISEMLGIIEIFMVPTMIYAFSPRFYGRLAVVAYAAASISLNFFYVQLFDFSM